MSVMTVDDLLKQLAENPIEELYPNENWEEDPANALLSACKKLALHFVELGSTDCALEALDQCYTQETKEKASKYSRLVKEFERGGAERLKKIVRENPVFGFDAEFVELLKRTKRASDFMPSEVSVSAKPEPSSKAPEGSAEKTFPTIVYFQQEFPIPSETFIVAEVAALLRKGVDVWIFALKINSELLAGSPIRDRVVTPSIAVDENDPFSSLAAEIAKLNPDYLHAHWVGVAKRLLLPIAEKLNVPLGFTAHAADLWLRGNRLEPEEIAEFTAHPLCVTAATIGSKHKTYLEYCGVPEEKILVTPNAVDPKRFPQVRPSAPKKIEKIVTLGRPVVKKGYLVAIDAVRMLRLKGKEVKLQLLGARDSNSELGQAIEQFSNALPFIEATDMLPYEEALERIKQADVLIAPCVVSPDGDSDGIPTVLVEAMLLGVPVISTDVGSVIDLVKDGETGFIARSGDAASLAQALERLEGVLSSGQGEALIERARKEAQRHDAKKTMDIFLGHLGKYLEPGRTSQTEVEASSIDVLSSSEPIYKLDNSPPTAPPAPESSEEDVIEMSKPLFKEAAEILQGTRIPKTAKEEKRREDGFHVLLMGGVDFTPDISVVIPTFNRPHLIKDAVDSVCKQEGLKLEIIIVNDAGESIPQSLMDDFTERNVPITLICHNENLGLGASRNTGVLFAKGEYVAVLDDDDCFIDGGLKALHEQAKERNAKFIIGDHIRYYFENDKKTGEEYFPRNDQVLEMLCLENWISCGTFIVERATFNRIGGYREDMKVHEDYNLHIRLAREVGLSHIARPIFIYNIRKSGRMNLDLRPYWFATSALNHEILRVDYLDNDQMQIKQRYNQYEHIKKALDGGTSEGLLLKLVELWWEELSQRGLHAEIEMDKAILSQLLPSFLGKIPGASNSLSISH